MRLGVEALDELRIHRFPSNRANNDADLHG
jgi:hypothetical protein